MLDAEGNVYQGVSAFRVSSLPYYPDRKIFPGNFLLLKKSNHDSSLAALLGSDASVNYPLASTGSRLDIAVIVGLDPRANLLFEDATSGSSRLARGFLAVISLQDIGALPGLLRHMARAESVTQQRNYLWSGSVSAEVACSMGSMAKPDDVWRPYFHRRGVGESVEELWGSVLLDFGSHRVLITRCDIDRASDLTPEIYDAIVDVWASYDRKRRDKNDY